LPTRTAIIGARWLTVRAAGRASIIHRGRRQWRIISSRRRPIIGWRWRALIEELGLLHKSGIVPDDTVSWIWRRLYASG
jgi:hypothetical protein